MTREELINGNKLIAEFMGIKRLSKHYWDAEQLPDFTQLEWNEDGNYVEKVHSDKLEYRISWQWLMPVVEKICRMEMKPPHLDAVHDNYLRTFGMISDETGEIMVRFNRGGLHSSKTLIEATYQACIEFITWHNTTPK